MSLGDTAATLDCDTQEPVDPNEFVLGMTAQLQAQSFLRGLFLCFLWFIMCKRDILFFVRTVYYLRRGP